MDKEKTEQIKIALLGVIALLLIIRTVNMMSGSPEKAERPDRDGTPQAYVNDMGGITVGNPQPVGQTVVPQPVTQPTAPQPAKEVTTMSFDNITGDLGTVSIADNKVYTYTVTNTGLIPLSFGSITGDPGLIVTSQPTAPIAPGGTGKVEVTLGPDAGTGPISKTIHVGANTDPGHMHLTLNANVK